MKVADATDVPNLILRFSPRIAAVFDPFTFFAVVFFAPCGQNPSLTMPRKLCVGFPPLFSAFSRPPTLNCFLPPPPLRRTLEAMSSGFRLHSISARQVDAARRGVKLYAASRVRVKPLYADLTPAEIQIVEGAAK